MIRTLRADLSLFLVSGVLFVIEVLVLLSQLRLIQLPFGFGGDTDSAAGIVVGKVLSKESSLKERSAASLSWYPLRLNDAVRLNASYLTGPSAHATLELRDGARIELGPETLVTLTSSPEFFSSTWQILLNRGKAHIKSHGPLKVKLPEGDLALNPFSEVTLGLVPLVGIGRISLIQGHASLSPISLQRSPSTFEKIELQTGQEVPLAPGSHLSPLSSNVSIRIIRPRDDENLSGASAPLAVRFEWEGGEGGAVELTTDPNFFSPKVVTGSARSAEARLDPGRYFWRVETEHSVGAQHAFTVMPPLSYLVHPPKQPFTTDTPIELSWEDVPEAIQYRAQLSRVSDFSTIDKTKSLARPEWSLGKLTAGRYFWRIRAEHPKYGSWPESRAFSFVVREPLGAPRPRGFRILKKHSSFQFLKPALRRFERTVEQLFLETDAFAAESSGEGREVEVEFNWDPVPGAVSYWFEVSDTVHFKKLLFSQKINEPTIQVRLPVQDKVYWRIAAEDAYGIMGRYSLAQVSPLREIYERQLAEEEMQKKKEQAERQLPAKELSEQAPPPGHGDLAPYLHVGIEGAYEYEGITGQNYQVQSQGLPLNRMIFGSRWDVSAILLEGTFSYLPRKYISQTPGQPNAERDEYGGELIVQDIFRTAHIPWGMGVQAELIPVFAQHSSLELAGEWMVSATAGPTLSTQVLKRLWWENRFLVEAAPFGDLRGVGLNVASRFYYERLWGPLAPELDLGLRSGYDWQLGGQATAFRTELSLAISLRASWDTL